MERRNPGGCNSFLSSLQCKLKVKKNNPVAEQRGQGLPGIAGNQHSFLEMESPSTGADPSTSLSGLPRGHLWRAICLEISVLGLPRSLSVQPRSLLRAPFSVLLSLPACLKHALTNTPSASSLFCVELGITFSLLFCPPALTYGGSHL